MDVESEVDGGLSHALVVDERGIDVQSDSARDVDRVEGAQGRPSEEASLCIEVAWDIVERHSVQNAGHRLLSDSLADRCATQLSL
jgi:hypothetical protein